MAVGYMKKVEEYKYVIRSSNYEKFEERDSADNLVGTLYLKEKMDYGFHIFYIHEPSNTNPLAGKNGTVTEMFYDLRHKKYWIKRNLKDVNFSVRNVDSIFPRDSRVKNVVFSLLSTRNNQGLYMSAYIYLGAMNKETTEMFGRFFHRLITDHSYYELLYKAGIKVHNNIKINNKNGSTPAEVLGLSKTQWKIVSKFKINPSIFQKRRTDESGDHQLINYLNLIKTYEEEYGLDKIHEFIKTEIEFIYKINFYHRSALKIAEEYNLPDKKFLKYIYFECDVSQGLSVSTAITEYEDYIRMTKEMDYVRFERYPKYLKTIHDIVSRNYKVKLDEIKLKQWEIEYEKNKQFQYTYQGYKIFPPKEPKELIEEGNVLGHCVGSYVDKVAKGLSTILFLRETKDLEKPLVTIEVKNNLITQAKGKMNYPPTTKEKNVIEKFAKKFNLNLSHVS